MLTEHGSEEVEIRNGFQVVMAMNLGKGYAVNTLDTALLNRFPCVLEYRYLTPKEEENLLVQETGIDPDIAHTMVKVANETRRLKRNKEISGEITPRGLFAWATKFKAKTGKSILPRLKAAAKVTWMHQVAGTDAYYYGKCYVNGEDEPQDFHITCFDAGEPGLSVRDSIKIGIGTTDPLSPPTYSGTLNGGNFQVHKTKNK